MVTYATPPWRNAEEKKKKNKIVRFLATHSPGDLKHAEEHERQGLEDGQDLDQVAGPLTEWSPLAEIHPGVKRGREDHRLLHLHPVDVSATIIIIIITIIICFVLSLIVPIVPEEDTECRKLGCVVLSTFLCGEYSFTASFILLLFINNNNNNNFLRSSIEGVAYVAFKSSLKTYLFQKAFPFSHSPIVVTCL